MQTVYGATASTGSQIGLGDHIFEDTSTTVTLTCKGDIDDVEAYGINRTFGYIIDSGTATVTVRDETNDFELSATFNQDEIYIGTDIPGQGNRT